MTWSSVLERWASLLLGPSPFAIAVGTVIAFTLPLLVHYFLYRSATKTGLPAFLLVGPSGSGKTALLTYLERGSHATTHTSQAPLTVEGSVPASMTSSSGHRSANDPTTEEEVRFLLIDTPGHGKLRYFALDQLANPDSLRGIIYVVDATNLSDAASDAQSANGLREAAEYLHDILLVLQRRSMNAKASRSAKPLPVLIAANKLDLFTALPTPLVKAKLEGEITRIRESRSKGLLDSGIGMGDIPDLDEGKDWLGARDDGRFTFLQMADVNVPVALAGGYVAGPEGADVKEWRRWVGSQL